MITLSIFDMTRVRKTRAFKIDEALITGLTELARRKNVSANRMLENVLFDVLRNEGVIDPNIEPLGETRGGDQRSNK